MARPNSQTSPGCTFDRRLRKSQICIKNLSNGGDSKNVYHIRSDALPPLPTTFLPLDTALDPVGLSTAGGSIVSELWNYHLRVQRDLLDIYAFTSSDVIRCSMEPSVVPYKRCRCDYATASRNANFIGRAHSFYRCKVVFGRGNSMALTSSNIWHLHTKHLLTT